MDESSTYKKKKMPSLNVRIDQSGQTVSGRWRRQADIWSMMTRAPMGTTVPACTHWLIMVQHWCHSSHRTSSTLCFPRDPPPPSCQWNSDSLSWSERSPLCCCFFLADWLRFVSRCSGSSEAVLKCRATLAAHHCGSSASLRRHEPFYACRAPLCENRRTAPATWDSYTWDFDTCSR